MTPRQRVLAVLIHAFLATMFLMPASVALGQAVPGIITTVVGNTPCHAAQISGEQVYVCGGGFSGDGGPAVDAKLSYPAGLALDTDGNLFIADSQNNRIRRVDHDTGVITTFAGKGTEGFSGDDGPATSAELKGPSGLALDASDNLFIADTGNNRIRRVGKTTGIIATVAGDGTCCSGHDRGDGGVAIKAALDKPYGILVDVSGNLFIADYFNYSIRRVDYATRIISTVAGGVWHNGQSGRGFSGDGGLARDAQLDSPSAITTDSSGNLFIADTLNRHVRRVDHASGIITTVAGSTLCKANVSCTGTFGGDDGPATAAVLSFPFGVAVDAKGDVLIADTGNNRIRKVHLAAVEPPEGRSSKAMATPISAAEK